MAIKASISGLGCVGPTMCSELRTRNKNATPKTTSKPPTTTAVKAAFRSASKPCRMMHAAGWLNDGDVVVTVATSNARSHRRYTASNGYVASNLKYPLRQLKITAANCVGAISSSTAVVSVNG